MTKRALPILLAASFIAANLSGQQGGRNAPPLPQLRQTCETAQQKFRVSIIATGLANPWSFAFLPTGDVLVTERAGQLRIFRGGVLGKP